jgi:hypothetical protein
VDAGVLANSLGRASSRVKSPTLEIVENTGDFVWLGVRDDFRNWFIRAAA